MLNAGDNQTLSVTFTPTDNIDYTIATAMTTISVNPATPIITWASPAPITYGTPLGPTQLDATASVPGSFAYAPAAGVVLNAGDNQTLSVTFTPVDHVNYTIATAMTTISVNPATPIITWPSPAPIAYGTASGRTQLDAKASVPGSFVYSPAAGTVLQLGNNQPLSVTFAPTDTIDYTSTTVTTRITVVTATTVVALASSSADPSTYGQSVTFKAAVATIGCGPTAISGIVKFYDGKPVRGNRDRIAPSRHKRWCEHRHGGTLGRHACDLRGLRSRPDSGVGLHVGALKPEGQCGERRGDDHACPAARRRRSIVHGGGASDRQRTGFGPRRDDPLPRRPRPAPGEEAIERNGDPGAQPVSAGAPDDLRDIPG